MGKPSDAAMSRAVDALQGEITGWPDRVALAIDETRSAAIEECARWHDDGAINADYGAQVSALDHKTAQRHREHARQHRYAAEQLRALNQPNSASAS